MTSDRKIPGSYWVYRRHLLAGDYPGSLDDDEARLKVRSLLKAGVTTFMDLTEEGELTSYVEILNEEAHDLGISAQHQRRQIRTSGVPTAEAMINTLNAIDDAIASGAVVYLHCFDGIDRTGMVIGCYLN